MDDWHDGPFEADPELMISPYAFSRYASNGMGSGSRWNFDRSRWVVTPEERDARHSEMARRMAPYGFREYESGVVTSHLESGHSVLVRLTPETNHWHAVFYHKGDPSSQETWVGLGRHDEHVPDIYGKEMRHPETMRSLYQQYQRAAANGDPTGDRPDRRIRQGGPWHAGDVHGHYVDYDDDDH
jgi:hypothetical protein